ncbi:MAG: hypothetical protein ACK5TR_07115 [Alphaproteobacteria bacterium]|jgi:hypothetical protein|nr:hypothetical protein [Alphaproteobacteria bacterium]
MSFYFYFLNDDEKETIHRKEPDPVNIFNIEIEGKEGQLPHLRLRVQNMGVGLNTLAKKRGCLFYERQEREKELLFYGRLVSVAENPEGETVELLLVAESPTHDQDLQELTQSLQKSPLWDPLFVAKEHLNDPSEVLETRPEHFYWCRTTNKVSLSSLFWGRTSLKVGNNFYGDSLNIKLCAAPLEGVKVILKASWVQKYQGVSDVTSLIRSRFPGGLVNSLTGEDLEAKWWRTGERLGRSGYWIDHSELNEINPPRTGMLNLYPAYSVRVWASPYDPYAKDLKAPKEIRFKRKWFHAKLILGWKYRQKRSEYVELYLRHDVQDLGMPLSTVRTLKIPLQGADFMDESTPWRSRIYYTAGFHVVYEEKIYRCVEGHLSAPFFDSAEREFWEEIGDLPDLEPLRSRASFFTTNRGHKAIGHALEIAKTHLAASARAVEISFSGSFEMLYGITCDHDVSLTDPRLPGGEVRGKVISYRLVADGRKGIFRGDVVLGCAVGKSVQEAISNPVEEDEKNNTRYVGFAPVKEIRSPSGLIFESVFDQGPKRGLLNPQGMSAIDLVEEIRVSGDPDAQNNYLLDQQYPKRHHLLSCLKEKKTEIFIRLKDLRTKGSLKHRIYAKVLNGWTAPAQVDLG